MRVDTNELDSEYALSLIHIYHMLHRRAFRTEYRNDKQASDYSNRDEQAGEAKLSDRFVIHDRSLLRKYTAKVVQRTTPMPQAGRPADRIRHIGFRKLHRFRNWMPQRQIRRDRGGGGAACSMRVTGIKLPNLIAPVSYTHLDVYKRQFSSVATHWLPNIIRAFQKDYPHIDYELLLGDYTEIETWIMEGRVDCGFLRLPAHPDLETIFLEQDPLLAVLPVQHPLADCSRFPVSAFGSEPFRCV